MGIFLILLEIASPNRRPAFKAGFLASISIIAAWDGKHAKSADVFSLWNESVAGS
jgi:hypothetical protein